MRNFRSEVSLDIFQVDGAASGVQDYFSAGEQRKSGGYPFLLQGQSKSKISEIDTTLNSLLLSSFGN
jgi:hypothetical protein